MEKALRITLIAAILRFLIAPFFGHIWDIKTLQETVYYALRGENVYVLVYTFSVKIRESTGQLLFYEGYAYPPHIMLVLLPFYAFYLVLGGDPQPIRVEDSIAGVGLFYEHQVYLTKDVFLFMTLIKTPMIVADSLIVYLLGKRNLRIAMIYALSPYVILITGVWGMFDSLIALSLLISIMLLENGRYTLSGLTYGFSLMKLYPLLTLPVFILNLRRRGLGALSSFMLGFIISQIPTLAYLILDPPSFIYTVLLFHLLRHPSGLTPLRILGIAENETLVSIVSASHTMVSIIIYVIILTYILKNNIDIRRSVILTLLYFLAFSKIVHDQFYIALYPLLLQLRSREARIIEVLFTSYTLINTGIFLTAPTLLFIIDYKVLQLKTSIIYSDIGYITINVIGSLLNSLISILTFTIIMKTILNVAKTEEPKTTI